MKKLVALFPALFLPMPLCPASLAEEFTLHNGTIFGMTEDEIKALLQPPLLFFSILKLIVKDFSNKRRIIIHVHSMIRHVPTKKWRNVV